MKPLRRKNYGSIAHLPNSRLGPSDKQANPGHVKIATQKKRDKHDKIIVQEKLDGSNVGVAKLQNNSLVPLTRAGYEATTSPYEQHHYWAVWVWEHSERFDKLLARGEWCVGEWCIQAHSTKYVFPSEPFFLFDLFRSDKRVCLHELMEMNISLARPFEVPHVIHEGEPIGVDEVLQTNPELGRHGAVEPIEGYVWRVERRGQVDFLAKYVRPEKTDGIYLPGVPTSTTSEPIFNYWNDDAVSILKIRNHALKEAGDELRSDSRNTHENAEGRKCIRRR